MIFLWDKWRRTEVCVCVWDGGARQVKSSFSICPLIPVNNFHLDRVLKKRTAKSAVRMLKEGLAPFPPVKAERDWFLWFRRGGYYHFHAFRMSSLFKSTRGLRAWVGEKMKMTGHGARLEERRSHSLSPPLYERLISREAVGDGEKWESGTRRLLSSAPRRRVTHCSRCC